MSWYVSYVGKPAAVRGAAASNFNPENLHYDEPEKSVIRHIHSVIEAAISELPDSLPVKIMTSGSQAVDKSIQVTLTIEPLWLFLE